jgi:hypothetical protein
MWSLAIWNKVEISKGIHLLNLMGENNPKYVEKSFQKNHLPTNGACVGMQV